MLINCSLSLSLSILPMYTMIGFSHSESRNKICSIFLLMYLVIAISSSTKLAGAESNSSPSHFSKFSRASTAKALPQSPNDLFDHSVYLSMSQAELAHAHAYNLSFSSHKVQTHYVGGMSDCMELLDDTLDQLSNVVNHKNNLLHSHNDVQTWLSAALTNQETCMQSLEKHKFQLERGIMDSMAKNLSHLISKSLALYKSTKPKQDKTLSPSGNGGRKLLSDGFPTWLSASERKLLGASIEELEVNGVVAKDGSGSHKTVGEALGLVTSLAGGGRTVIHVKAGTYHENLNIPTKQKNVMLVGDGKGKTVIVGSRNSDDGWTTYKTATVAAMGDGFIARDITFVNSAGPAKEQAVALRVGSDKSVIYRCSVLGYQDSLYTHSKRQFYRETDIYGTVDFIFGNSVVVFQNCNIYARKPLSGQHNFITAQGRTNPNQNTGISIHNCKIVAASDLAASKSKIATYLGRPWKQYSRTVIMQSSLDDSIHPSGWSAWSGNFALKTLYYGEYMNSGPGASTSGRVKWAGYHASLTSGEAEKFTVGGFIAGNMWLPSTGVSFDSGLLG